MSLLRWSKRRTKDCQVLPVIPNEIYFYVFELIAPPTVRLAPEELKVFSNLSRVCRLFANVCLPRIFESVEFSGFVFRDHTPRTTSYKASLGSTFCTQILAMQPLALSLAKRVRVCNFTNWQLDDTGSWVVRLFAKKYIAAMLRMENIRELRFSVSFVDTEHWSAMATLASLEELSFDTCRFLQGPADAEPEERIKVKVSRLRVTKCDGSRQPFAAVDPRCLHTLGIDLSPLNEVDWLSQTALTEIHVYVTSSLYLSEHVVTHVHDILERAPRSLETLRLSVDAVPGIFPHMLDAPAWKNLPLLRLLMVQAPDREFSAGVNYSSVDGDGLHYISVNVHAERRVDLPDILLAEVGQILRDRFGPACSLRCVNIFGNVFRFVDGEWSEGSCSTV